MNSENPYSAPSTLELSSVSEQASTAYHQTKSLKGITKLLVILLMVGVAMDLVLIIGNSLQLSLLSRQYTTAEAEANDLRQNILAITYLGVFIFTAIVFLNWVSRACKNCHGYGAMGMQTTPGWAIGYYFTPILNLFRPFQSMKEIDQISQNPAQWTEQKPNAILGWWWGFWILSGFMGQINFRLPTATIDELLTVSRFGIVSAMVSIILAIFALKVVTTIARNQEKLITAEI
jgi:hypothetical protein